jgi:hypothetical protein
MGVRSKTEENGGNGNEEIVIAKMRAESGWG